jgi:hypothetical protein
LGSEVGFARNQERNKKNLKRGGEFERRRLVLCKDKKARQSKRRLKKSCESFYELKKRKDKSSEVGTERRFVGSLARIGA